MPSEARLKKNTEQLKEGLKSSILGPQNLGSGGPGPLGPPLDPLVIVHTMLYQFYKLDFFSEKDR